MPAMLIPLMAALVAGAVVVPIQAEATATVTPTPTLVPMETRTPWPTSTQTLTVTPVPSPTPGPTATCPPGWEPRLELSFVPAAVRGGQAVTAHLDGHNFGFYTANVSLSMADQRTIQHGWRSDRGWIGSASFGFAAPAASGTWTAYASGYGEVAFCMNGSLGWGYGGTGSRQVPLEVSGAMLYLPDVDRPEAPEDVSRTSERAGELLAGPWSPTDHGRHAIGEPQ